MDLLNNFLSLLSDWKDSFSYQPTSLRAQSHAVGSLCGSSPHTITSIISFNGKSSQDPSADYKLYSRSKWDENSLFNSIIEQAVPYFDKHPCLVAAADNTAVKKTGKKIKSAFYQRDPMSPHFHTNLIFGQRFMQISLTLPLYQLNPKTPARGIPVCFSEAPSVKKPKKKAKKEEIKKYKQLKKEINLSLMQKKQIQAFRETLDAKGIRKELLITADGALCNRNFLGGERIQNTGFVVRCRKDIQLCHQNKDPKDKNRFYDKNTFTPQNIYSDPNIAWKRIKIFRGGCYRWVFYKEVKNVFWRTSLKREPLNLIVLKRTPYRLKKGTICYRKPAFLLCIRAKDCQTNIQSYHDRGEIELNIKDEKFIGVAQAQVRNSQSVQKNPTLVVASYSALMFSSLKTYQDIPYVIEYQSWRKDVRRLGVRMLLRQLKKEVLNLIFVIKKLKVPPEAVDIVLGMVA